MMSPKFVDVSSWLNCPTDAPNCVVPIFGVAAVHTSKGTIADDMKLMATWAWCMSAEC
jgi:hypothetical protein